MIERPGVPNEAARNGRSWLPGLCSRQALFEWSCPHRGAAPAEATRQHGATPKPEFAPADCWSGPVVEQRCGFLDDPAGKPEYFAHPTTVEHEPLAAIATRVESRQRRREHIERTAHRLEQDEVTATDTQQRHECA